jgi:acylphosphatase
MGQTTALTLTVHGRVQGVWYRDWTVETARGLGLTGWVRNQPDDTVTALLQGDAANVRQMVEKMHEGPPRAEVDRIDQQPCAPEPLEDFIRT